MSPARVQLLRAWSPARVHGLSSAAPEGVQKSNVPFRGTGLDSWTLRPWIRFGWSVLGRSLTPLRSFHAKPTGMFAPRNLGLHVHGGEKYSVANGLDRGVIDQRDSVPAGFGGLAPADPGVRQRSSRPDHLVQGWVHEYEDIEHCVPRSLMNHGPQSVVGRTGPSALPPPRPARQKVCARGFDRNPCKYAAEHGIGGPDAVQCTEVGRNMSLAVSCRVSKYPGRPLCSPQSDRPGSLLYLAGPPARDEPHQKHQAAVSGLGIRVSHDGFTLGFSVVGWPLQPSVQPMSGAS